MRRHDHRHQHQQHGLDQRQHRGHAGVELLVVELGDDVQHVAQRSRLLPDLHHLERQVLEHAGRLERARQARALARYARSRRPRPAPWPGCRPTAAATSSAFSSGSPPASSVDERAHQLARRVHPHQACRSTAAAAARRSTMMPVPSRRYQYTKRDQRAAQAETDPQQVRAQRAGDRQQDPRRQRQLHVQALVEALGTAGSRTPAGSPPARASSRAARSGRPRRRPPSS